MVPHAALLSAALLAAAAAAAPSWSKVATVGAPYAPRGEASLSLCGAGSVCLLGGRGSSPVGVFDTAARAWTAGKNPPFEINHFQAFRGPDGCAWVVGAWTGPFPAEKTVDSILKYCPADDTWTTGEKIARPRGAGGALYYKGAVYLVSGNVGGHNSNAKLVDWFDKFDPDTGKWTTLPPVPHPRDHCSAVILDDKLYLVAGRDSTGEVPAFFTDVVKEVDVFDFATQKWSTLAQEFPRPRAGIAATAFEGQIFVMGGEGNRGDSSAWNEVDILKGSTFKPGPDMPTPRHGFGAVTCNGAIWVAGGVTVLGGGTRATDTVAYFDGDTPPVCTSSSSTEPPPTTSTSTSTETATDATTTTTTTTATTAETTGTTVPATTTATVTDEPPMTPSPAGSDPTITPSALRSTAPNSTPSAQATKTPTPGTAGASPSAKPTPSGVTSDATGDGPDSPPEQQEADSEAACFPSDARVELRDGSFKTMAEVRIGDHVKVAYPDGYSPVFFFSHHHPQVSAEMVKIETSVKDVSLHVAPSHLIYVNDRLVPAASVKIGDEVSLSHADSSRALVTAVRRTTKMGLHNPHTVHGDIVVNGVLASTFTSTVHPSLAKILLSPFRLMYHFVGPHTAVENVNRVVLRALDYSVWKRRS